MRFSKILLVCLIALVCATTACTQPAQPAAQVVTVVVTAPPAPSPTSPLQQASQTLAPSPTPPAPATETSLPSPTTTEQATQTLLPPSPTATIQVAQVRTPTRTPAPQLPAVSNLPANGPKDTGIDFEVVLSREYLLRIKARKHGSVNDGDGIDHVLIMVIGDSNVKLYSNSEKTAKYCIFQGGEPDCNPWPITNGHYVWGVGGPEIKSGEYQVTLRIALKSDPTNESEWNFFLTIKLP